MIIVAPFQVRLFCNIISCDAWWKQSYTSKFWIPVLDFPNLWEYSKIRLKCISSADVSPNKHLSLHSCQCNRDTTAKVWVGEPLQLYLGKKLLSLPLPTPPRFSLKRAEILALPIMVHRDEDTPSSSDTQRLSSTSDGILGLVEYYKLQKHALLIWSYSQILPRLGGHLGGIY